MTAPPDQAPRTPDDRHAAGRAPLAAARRVVVKIGSRALVDTDGTLDEDRLGDLVTQMARLHETGREVVAVSSGAVAAGLPGLALERRPTDLPTIQAAAAVGQARLMEVYRRRFAAHGIAAGQVLLTHADLRARDRHLNARHTLSRLLAARAVPVINENDTVAVDEIRVGDNDLLSAYVAVLLHADALVMLTMEDGLLTRPPGEDGAVLIPFVDRIDDDVLARAGGAGSTIGTGGMRSKLEAADVATRCGSTAVVAHGHAPDVLLRVLEGDTIGTVFAAHPGRLPSRKRWIAFFDHPRGVLVVDDGAARAIVHDGRSLLPVGIRAVEGTFGRGQPVRIQTPDGREVARGLVNYPAGDVRRIMGRASAEIADVLGRVEYESVVHRDNLVLR